MKLSDAQRICSDFAPVKQEDGRVKCRHLMPDDMCKLPSHFVCELVSFKKKPPQYTSVSRTQIYQKCERAFAFQYYWKVEPMKPSPWKAVGQCFSLCRAKIDAGLPHVSQVKDPANEPHWSVPDDLPDITDKWKLEWILGEYAKLPPVAGTNELRVEYEIEHGPPAIMLVGYLDKLVADRKKIQEWKYTVDGSYYTIQSVRLQVSAYFGAVPEAEEVVICIAKKSKNERLMATPKEKQEYTKGKAKGKGKGKTLVQEVCEVCLGTGKANGFRKWLPTSCKVCGQPQFDSPSGDNCMNGHGGAPGIPCDIEIILPEPEDCGNPECWQGKLWEEKPRLYAGQRATDETEAEFKQRLKEKHPYPFEYKTFLRSEFDIDGDRELMRRLYHRQEDAKRFKIFDPNFANCGDCDFSDVCSTHSKGPGCDEPTCSHPAVCHLVKIREAKVKPVVVAPVPVVPEEQEGI